MFCPKSSIIHLPLYTNPKIILRHPSFCLLYNHNRIVKWQSQIFQYQFHLISAFRIFLISFAVVYSGVINNLSLINSPSSFMIPDFFFIKSQNQIFVNKNHYFDCFFHNKSIKIMVFSMFFFFIVL